MDLSNLRNVKGAKKSYKRVGRGPGCKKGKTCGRGVKGDKSRSGYKRRYGKEGGQVPLFKKIPTRGFTNGRFKKTSFAITLDRIEELFEDGEKVNLLTLQEKGIAPRVVLGGLRILANGELKKKVVIEADHFTAGAIKKLEGSSIEFKTL
ncbi:MAG: 50S ribosomal protein L15 [Simkaniaceae bacterium]